MTTRRDKLIDSIIHRKRITKTGLVRLLQLVDYMQSLPVSANEHFDMRVYIAHKESDHKHVIPENPTVEDLHACGTAACALGWAITEPSLRKAGLFIERFADTYFIRNSYEVFGIKVWDVSTWYSIFGSNNKDSTPKAWAKRVRKLVDT